ncbi:TPA: phage tail protein [Escherichia coli]|nr:phage tail protein [Escherichia coli]
MMPVSRNRCIFLNVGLGEAAKRNVGTGENQIPDMSAFPSGKNWFQLPSGHIVQMFSMNVYGADTNGTTGNFPIAFPSGALAVSALWSDGTLTAAPTFKLMGYTTTRTSVTLKVSTGNGLYRTMIIAIGR